MAPEDDLRVRHDLKIPSDEIRETVSRSSGPGGQHVNKTSTRVTLRWNLPASAAPSEVQRERMIERLARRLTRTGDLVVSADETRSQSRNREIARARIVEILRESLTVERARRPTKPSRAAKGRRTDAKTRRGVVKRTRGRVDPQKD